MRIPAHVKLQMQNSWRVTSELREKPSHITYFTPCQVCGQLIWTSSTDLNYGKRGEERQTGGGRVEIVEVEGKATCSGCLVIAQRYPEVFAWVLLCLDYQRALLEPPPGEEGATHP